MATETGKASAGGAVAGLLTFGGTIGVITALSDAKGTVVTLLGLLFALIGGSLVSLFKSDGLSDAQRDGMFRAAGWLGGGILLGIAVGFSSIIAEEKWFPAPVSLRVREAAAEMQKAEVAKAEAAKAEANAKAEAAKTEVARRDAERLQRRLVLHANETDKINALRKSLRAQLSDAAMPAEEKAVLRQFGELLDDTAFLERVSKAAEVVQSSKEIQDTFASQFRASFGQPVPADK